MPLSRRDLPLNALRSFEAAARHCHLRKAAAELGVTHGAISRQVRLLEESLGVELFDRSHNRLALTSAGRRLLLGVSDALDRITESTLYLDPESVAGSLLVAATPSMATGWLLAMIGNFGRKYPEIEVRLVNIEPGQRDLPPEADVAICFGEPGVSQQVVQELFRERYFPVCSPGLLSPGDSIEQASDLLRYPLIHDQHGRWHRWLAGHGLDPARARHNLYLEQSFQVLSAAREGCGIGLADRIEVANDLRSGNLVALAEDTVEAGFCHYLVTQQAPRMTVRARLLVEHILRELENA